MPSPKRSKRTGRFLSKGRKVVKKYRSTMKRTKHQVGGAVLTYYTGGAVRKAPR